MTTAADFNSITLNHTYQSPEIVAGMDSASAWSRLATAPTGSEISAEMDRASAWSRLVTAPTGSENLAGMDSASAVDVDTSVDGQQGQSFTLTDFLVQKLDPNLAPARELEEKARQTKEHRQAYQLRIETLRTYAIEDGHDLNAASERDFWSFIHSEPFIRKGNLVLLDNGNLRAVWKDEQDSHIGLHFLGNQTVQYVIFKRRAAASPISRVAGRDTIEGVIRQIAAFNLQSLIRA